MRTLWGYFRQFFAIELPREFLYQGEDKLHGYSHVKTPEPDLTKACLFANNIAVEHDLLPVATEVPESMFMAFPTGFYMMGMHEYGWFNRWFYYVRVDDWRRIFMRIPYGAGYSLGGESNVYGKISHEYLLKYLDFERKLQRKVEYFEVLEDPYGSRYKVFMPDSQKFEYQGGNLEKSLLDKPDFEGVFSDLWPMLADRDEANGRDADLDYRQLRLPGS